MKLAIFWLSYLWFPFVLFAIWILWRSKQTYLRAAVALLLLASLPLAWGRFVEPRLLLVNETHVDMPAYPGSEDQVRIALFADTHIGLFANAHSMERLVDEIENLSVDAVFLAGDLLYEIAPDRIEQTVAPLSDLSIPTFVVRGNHDIGAPGPDYGPLLWDALVETGVTLVENRSFETEIGGRQVLVVGTSDLWQRDQTPRVRFDSPPETPVLLLTHNPDLALSVPEDVHFDLLLAGHTHGGQIRLPFLTRYAIPTEYPFDSGLHTLPNGRQVFVTAGTGMVGLPMRFGRPPRIDVLTLNFAVED